MSLPSPCPSDAPPPPHSPHTVLHILRLLNRSPSTDKQLHESHAHQQYMQQQQEAATVTMWRSGHNGRGRGHSRDGPKADGGGGGGERKVAEGQRQEATQRSAAIIQRAPAPAAAAPPAEPLSLPQTNVTIGAAPSAAPSEPEAPAPAASSRFIQATTEPKLSWPLSVLTASPSPSASPSDDAAVRSVRSGVVTAAPIAEPESLMACIERFLLCEHRNSANILLYCVTLALFVSDSLSKRIPLVPATTRLNVGFKTTVAAGLVAQLVFELKNVDRSVWLRSTANVSRGQSSAGMTYANSGSSLYRLYGSNFSLSPEPVSQPSFAAARPGGFPASASAGLQQLAPSPFPAATSNLTTTDRALESVGMSLLMLAFNSLMLKRFFPQSGPVMGGGGGAGTPAAAVTGSALSMPTMTKIYTLCNMVGLLGAFKQLLVAVVTERHARMRAARLREAAAAAASIGRNNTLSAPKADESVSSLPAITTPAVEDSRRSLPLILPSFSFIILIHALFMHPQSPSLIDAQLLGPAAAGSTGAVAGIRGVVQSALAQRSTLVGSGAILRVMAVLSAFYWAAHYKYTQGAGAPRPRMAANIHASSVSDGVPPSFWRGTSQLASNIKIVACLLVLTKMLA